VDGTYEGRAKPVNRLNSEPLFDAGGDPCLQLPCGPLSKRERDDAGRVSAAGDELGEPLGNDLGLAGSSRGDDLQMCAPVQYRAVSSDRSNSGRWSHGFLKH